MYKKVYFKTQILSFTSTQDVGDVDHPVILLENLSHKEIIDEFTTLISNLGGEDVTFVYSNCNLAFDLFKKQFILLEAAGGLVLNEKHELLLIKRWGKWDLPKGKVENGEELHEAAIREVEEECGIAHLKLVSHNIAYVSYHIYESKYHQNHLVLKPTYWYLMSALSTTDLTPQALEDIELVDWFKADEVRSKYRETYSSLLPVFEEGIKHLKK